MADNSKATAKKPRGKGRPFKKNDPVTGEKDPRINREGAPPRGASLKEILDYYDGLTADEIAAMLPSGDLRRQFLQMPKGIAMKHLKALRINAAIMFEPQAALIREIHERTDGKVADQVNAHLVVEGLNEVLSKVYGNRKNNGK